MHDDNNTLKQKARAQLDKVFFKRISEEIAQGQYEVVKELLKLLLEKEPIHEEAKSLLESIEALESKGIIRRDILLPYLKGKILNFLKSSFSAKEEVLNLTWNRITDILKGAKISKVQYVDSLGAVATQKEIKDPTVQSIFCALLAAQELMEDEDIKKEDITRKVREMGDKIDIDRDLLNKIITFLSKN